MTVYTMGMTSTLYNQRQTVAYSRSMECSLVFNIIVSPFLFFFLKIFLVLAACFFIRLNLKSRKCKKMYLNDEIARLRNCGCKILIGKQ